MRGRTKSQVKTDSDGEPRSGVFCSAFSKQGLLSSCGGGAENVDDEKYTIVSMSDFSGQLQNGESPYDASAEVEAYKEEIKAKLKQFDVDFQRQHGRMPTKEEKEPVRHLYKMYRIFKEEATVLDEEQQMKSTRADLEMYMNEIKAKVKEFDIEFRKQHGRLPTRQEKESIRHLYKIYNTFKEEAAALDKEKHLARAAVPDTGASHSDSPSGFGGSADVPGMSRSSMNNTTNTMGDRWMGDHIDEDVERWKGRSVSPTEPRRFSNDITNERGAVSSRARANPRYAPKSALASKIKEKKPKNKEAVSWNKLPVSLKSLRPKRENHKSTGSVVSSTSRSSKASRRSVRSEASSSRNSRQPSVGHSVQGTRSHKQNITRARGSAYKDSNRESRDAPNERERIYRHERHYAPSEHVQEDREEPEGAVFF